MDEPFVGKDVFSRRESLQRIVSGLDGHETVIVTTRLTDEIENAIDRAIIFHKGIVRADLYMDKIRTRSPTLTDVMQEVRRDHASRPFRWPEG